jgi:hypothetical protein
MQNRVSEVIHRDKKIIYADYSGLSFDDFVEVIGQQEAVSLKSPQKDILHLLNFTDCKMSTASKERANTMMKKLQENGYSVKTACFGIGSLQRLIASAVQKNMYFAKNMDDAKNWLVKE